MSMIRGERVMASTLHKWMASYAPYVDLSVREELISAYTATGLLTSLGNVWPMAYAAVYTNMFRSQSFVHGKNVGVPKDMKFDSYTSAVFAHMAHICSYVYIDDNLDDATRAFIKMSPTILATNKSDKRGSCIEWIEFIEAHSTQSIDYRQIHSVAQTIRA